MSENTPGKATVIITIVTVLGGVTTALITNWEKIFPHNKTEIQQPVHHNNNGNVPPAVMYTNNNGNNSSNNNNSACLYPFTSNRYVTEGDMRNLNKWDCKVMRNEIYARKGYVFSSQDLQTYFDQQPWYRRGSDNIQALKSLSDIEVANVSFIKQIEGSRQ